MKTNANIVQVKIEDIKPYENNPRHNEEAVSYVMNSIREFGFKVPIVLDKNNIIVTGHTRYKAAIRLGLKDCPCIIATDLTDEQIKAFRLADNKVGEIAKWDEDKLQEELLGLSDTFNVSDFGFEVDLNELEATATEDETESGEEKPEVEFSEVLGEHHNYVVLYFDNEVDWLQAESLFGLKTVQSLPVRGKGQEMFGEGRVLKGRQAIERIMRAIK